MKSSLLCHSGLVPMFSRVLKAIKKRERVIARFPVCVVALYRAHMGLLSWMALRK